MIYLKLHEDKIISKIIDENCFYQLAKYNITQEDFVSLKDVYLFVQQYTKEQGQTPDYRTVVEEFEGFDYQPQVSDKISYLAKKLKSDTITRMSYQMLQNEACKKFEKLSPSDFIEWLYSEVENIKRVTSVTNCSGSDYSKNGRERLERYLERKDKRSNIFVPTPWETLTKKMGGGFELGDYVLLEAFTNVGKSWIASQIGLEAWSNDLGVLHYSPEMNHLQQEQRMDTLLGHFGNMELRNGTLLKEKQYKAFLENFNENTNNKPYIVKTFEDMPDGLSTDLIEADLQSNPNCKVVIIDGFSLMNHRSKDNNRRNQFSDTSIKLRQIFGRHQVLGIVVHQVNTSSYKSNKEDDELGNRIVKPPEIEDYSETAQVIRDSCTILTFDQNNGVGKLKVVKARSNCVGFVLDLYVDFNNGYVTEVENCDYLGIDDEPQF